MAAHVTLHPDGTAEVRFTYDRQLIEQLKLVVPRWFRSYNGLTKGWTIRPPHVEDAIRLLERYCSPVDVVGATGRPEPVTSDPVEQAYQILHLRETAPAGLVEVVYRHLAKDHHPDRGGTDAAMRRLNAAMDTLRQRRIAS